MFGKFVKKKPEEIKQESKNKEKNDLFTLLEENQKPRNELKPSEPKPLKSQSENLVKKEARTNTPPKTNDISATNKSTSIKKIEQKIHLPPKDFYSQPLDAPIMPASSEILSKKFIPESSIKGDKSQLLLLEIEKLPDRTIKPFIDFNESTLFYPILAKIGESPDNISFLDDLVAERVLTKKVFEKLIICPHHPDTYSSTVRLYCPKCESLNVNKLNLYEHKRCGFITESTDYDFSNSENSVCPSCKRKILDFKKEIRVPAMWHQCTDCNEKFDNAIIKLYCRKHEHDFDTNSGQYITTYSYRLTDYEAPITSDDDKMHQDLEKLLKEFNFSTEFKAAIKGKSGNTHKIPIYAKNNINEEAIAIFIHRNSGNLSQVDINSILIPILDVGPKNVLLLTTSNIEEDVKPIAKQYGIEIISDPDLSKIIHFVDGFVSEKYSRNGEK